MLWNALWLIRVTGLSTCCCVDLACSVGSVCSKSWYITFLDSFEPNFDFTYLISYKIKTKRLNEHQHRLELRDMRFPFSNALQFVEAF